MSACASNQDGQSTLTVQAFLAVEEAADAQDAVSRLSGVYGAHFVYHLSQCPDSGIDAPFVKATYPPAWVGHYIVNNYVAIDPVVQEGFRRQLPFDWCELTVTPEAMKMMEEAVQFGLGGSGYSVPVVDARGRRALFSVNAPLVGDAWEDFVALHRADFAELAHSLHRRAIAEVFSDDMLHKLTPREVEVLQWSALGKETPMIAGIMGLGVHTVRQYVKSARYKLDAATVSHAVAKAARLRMISLDERSIRDAGREVA